VLTSTELNVEALKSMCRWPW